MNDKTTLRIVAAVMVAGVNALACSSNDSAGAVAACPDGAECVNLDTANDLVAAGLTAQNGMVSLDTTKPRKSGKSLHFTAMTGYAGRALVNLTPKSFPSGSFHGRAWMYAAQANGPGKNATLVEASGRATSPLYMNGASFDTQFRIGIQNAGPLLKVGYETPGWYGAPPNGPHTDCYQHSAVSMPVNRWFCMTWRFDTAARQMSFDVDGNRVLEIGETSAGCVGAGMDPTLGGKWVYPDKFDYLTLGWAEYETTSGSRELWIDDIAVGSKPIACE